MRSVYNYDFKYTAGLPGKVNPETGELWTDKERTALAQEIYPEASLCLVGGFVDAEVLRRIGHPCTKKKTAEFSWTPPAAGYVEVGAQGHLGMGVTVTITVTVTVRDSSMHLCV